MTAARAARAAACVLLLGACTLEPSYQRPDLPVAAVYPGSAATAPAPADAPAALAATQLGWRDFLRDARLQELVELALANNRDLRVAILNVEAARAQSGSAQAALFPALSGELAVARGPASFSPFSAGGGFNNVVSAFATVSWEVDLFGKLRSLDHAALEQYLASAQARKAAQILLVAEVATQYLTLLAADDALAVGDTTVRIAQESYRLAQLQYSAGSGSEMDLRGAQALLEQARAQLASAQRARAQARDALELLLGTPLPSDLPAGRRLAEQDFLADIPAGLPSDLLIRRPDIAQAEELLRAANADIGAARADFFPAIKLTGVAGTASPMLTHLFHDGTRGWGYVPSATVPIFAGGLNLANLRLADTQRAIAVAQYEKAVQTAFREVADALSARATYDDQVAAVQRQVKAQQRRLELAQLRYQTGVDSYLTLLVAQTDLNNAQLAQVAAQRERLVNLVALYQYLGGGWLEHGSATLPGAGARP